MVSYGFLWFPLSGSNCSTGNLQYGDRLTALVIPHGVAEQSQHEPTQICLKPMLNARPIWTCCVRSFWSPEARIPSPKLGRTWCLVEYFRFRTMTRPREHPIGPTYCRHCRNMSQLTGSKSDRHLWRNESISEPKTGPTDTSQRLNACHPGGNLWWNHAEHCDFTLRFCPQSIWYSKCIVSIQEGARCV
jgi:hypothetical protein